MAMLSYLVLTVAFASGAQALQPPTPGAVTKPCNYGDAQCKGIQAQPTPALQGTQASPLWVKVIQTGTDQPHANADAGKTKDGSPTNWRSDPNWWVALFTLLLAFTATVQAGFFVWQLRMMRETIRDSKAAANAARDAAKAAQDGAEAALLNAKAIINAERPWLVVGFKEINDTTTGASSIYAFTFINQGKTPAIVKKISIGHNVVTKTSDLPIPMRDEDLTPRDLPDLTLIVSKDSFITWPEVDPERLLEEHVETNQGGLSGKFLMIYGMIEYHDVFESWGPGRKPHRTRWSYGYDIRTGNLVSVGPDEYNSHT
jgi:hypothetical protein